MERKGLTKLLVAISLVLVILAVPLVAACEGTTDGSSSSVSSGESFTYRLATGSPELDSDSTRDMKNWAANIEEASGGRLKIEIYWNGLLGESEDALAMLDSGIADIIMEGYGYFSDNFPVSDVITLPYLVTHAIESGTLMNSLYHDGQLPEYDNIKLLMFKPQGPIMLFFREDRVTTLEDIEGLKIRTNTDGWANIVEALGGVPVSVATPDLYTSLETGVIDGLATGLGFFYPMGFAEVCDYALIEPLGGSLTFIAMSQEAWDRLPADLQLIVEQETEEYYWTNITHESDNWLNSYLLPAQAAGVELLYLTDDEKGRWIDATSFIVEDWAADKDAKGLAGSEAVERARLIRDLLR